jgi:hypothetical protein
VDVLPASLTDPGQGYPRELPRGAETSVEWRLKPTPDGNHHAVQRAEQHSQLAGLAGRPVRRWGRWPWPDLSPVKAPAPVFLHCPEPPTGTVWCLDQ